MTKELLLIDLLSEKDMIQKILKKYVMKHLIAIFMIGVLTSSFFFGIGKIVQHYLLNQTTHYFYQIRINELYHFSRFIGYFFLVILFILAFFYIMTYFNFRYRFQDWLALKIKTINQFEILEEDPNYLYFINNQEIKEQPTKKALLKKSIHTLHLSENNQELIIGQSRSLFGLYQIYFVLKPEHALAQTQSKSNKKQQFILYTLVATLAAGLLFSYLYLTSAFNPKEIKQAVEPMVEDIAEAPANGDILTPKHDIDINHFSELEMNYFYEPNIDTYFQTTNYGKSWQEVPISAADTRQGEYSLTSGQIPIGIFMEKSYDISPDFSWYLYTSDSTNDERLNLNFLASTDNGQTWKTYFIEEVHERIRYRKTQALTNGLMLLYTSTPTAMSEELFTLYSSNDQGKNWSHIADSTLNQPLQNVSFISQMTGFLATREKLFITQNGGSSFDETLINFPEDYSSEGLDIFTSPNEVTQKSASRLSIRLNLRKTKDIDIDDLFECEFISTDNGETWNFEKQIKRITL